MFASEHEVPRSEKLDAYRLDFTAWVKIRHTNELAGAPRWHGTSLRFLEEAWTYRVNLQPRNAELKGSCTRLSGSDSRRVDNRSVCLKFETCCPSVDKDTLWKGTVARGTIPRNVRGLGTLVPEEIRYVPAISPGRVEKRLVQPGAQVKADTVLFELTDPAIQQAFVDAETQLRGAQANLTTLKVQLDKTILDQEATLAQAKSDFNKAKMQFEVNDSLGKRGLKSKLEVDLSRIAAEDAENRVALETKRLAGSRDEAKARLAAEDEKVRQLKDAVQLKRTQMDALKVRAGIDGQLQTICSSGRPASHARPGTRSSSEPQKAEGGVEDR